MSVMMAFPNKIHLYIEKLNRKSGKVLFDFLDVNEFTYFVKARYNLSDDVDIGSIPSLIMADIESIPPDKYFHEGGMLTVSLNKLLTICQNAEDETKNKSGEGNNFNNVQTLPFLSLIKNKSQFLSILKDPDTKISKNPSKRYKISMDETLQFANKDITKDLENIIGDNLKAVIFDVGQGSANAVINCNGGIIYDLGTDAFRSRDIVFLRKEFKKIKCVLNVLKEKILILSHWDCDHYNLLNGMDDDDLKSLKLVLFPSEAYGLCAQQVYARIQKNCKKRYFAISPKNNAKKNTNKNTGIGLFLTASRLKIFRGALSTSKNLCGLLLTIKGKNGIVMFGGDHSNYQMWELMYHQFGVTNEIVNAVVPHHGSGKGTKLNLPQVSKYGVVVVSAGNGNIFHHPSLHIVNEYVNAGFTVKCTEQGPETNTKIGNLLINQKNITIDL